MGLINLSNGQNELVMSPNDLQYIADKYLGYEYAAEIGNLITQATEEEIYVEKRINTDLDSYESELESNRDCFLDISEQVEQFQSYLADAKRIERTKLNTLLNNILISINNQI